MRSCDLVLIGCWYVIPINMYNILHVAWSHIAWSNVLLVTRVYFTRLHTSHSTPHFTPHSPLHTPLHTPHSTLSAPHVSRSRGGGKCNKMGNIFHGKIFHGEFGNFQLLFPLFRHILPLFFTIYCVKLMTLLRVFMLIYQSITNYPNYLLLINHRCRVHHYPSP